MPFKNNSNKQAHYVHLDLLRISATLSVLGVHQYWNQIQYLCDFLSQNNLAFLAKIVYSFFCMGLTGVCVFFFVSGFAITHASIRESSKQFLIRRILRIYPLYILCSLLEFFLKLGGDHKAGDILIQIRQLVFNFIMIGDFFNIQPNLSGVAWTLRLEILFYATVYISMRIEKKFQNTVKIRITVLFSVAMFLGFISNFPSSPKLGNQYYIGIFFNIFLLGVVLALKRNKFLSASQAIFLCSIAFGMHVILVLESKHIFLEMGNYIIATFSCITLASLMKLNPYLEFKVIRFAKVTYSFYLLHTFFLTFIIDQIQMVFLPRGNLGVFCLTLFSTFILLKICFFIYDKIENPLIKYSKTIN